MTLRATVAMVACIASAACIRTKPPVVSSAAEPAQAPATAVPSGVAVLAAGNRAAVPSADSATGVRQQSAPVDSSSVRHAAPPANRDSARVIADSAAVALEVS